VRRTKFAVQLSVPQADICRDALTAFPRMNSPATIEAEAPPETLLVEEALTEELLADGEPPVLTEEATADVAFAHRPDRLLRGLVFSGVLVAGIAGGAVLVYSLSGSKPDAPVEASPVAEAAVAKPEDTAARASRKQIEDVAAAAEGDGEPPANPSAVPVAKPEQNTPVAEAIPPVVVAQKPMTALEAAVAAERTRHAQTPTALPRAQALQRQATAKPVKTAECSLMGDDIAKFRKCVEKFNQ
jgi:hypothetical protein